MAGEVSPSEFFDNLLRDYKQNAFLDDLAGHVKKCAREAASHRSQAGVETEMLRGIRAVKNQYDPEDQMLLEGMDIYMGVTNIKVRAFRAWVSDIMLHSEDKPWVIAPTPQPELPADVEALVLDQLQDELAEFGMEFDLKSRIKEVRSIANKHIKKVAAEATEGMEDLVNDQLLEGGWREAFDAFVSDLSTYPSAILKGPTVAVEKTLRWKENKLEQVEQNRYIVKRVNPFDMFPSPNSTDCQNGTYIIERMKMTEDDLMNAIGVSGFKEIAVRSIISEHPYGCKWTEFQGSDSEREDYERVDTESTTNGNRYDVLVYYGKIKGSMLLDWGVVDADPQKMQECEVWVCGNVALRAILNPHPLGHRPFYSTSFDKTPGSFWGTSLPALLRDVQRMTNASARSLVKNMALSAGPVGEYDTSRVAAEEDVSEVRPFRLFAVDSDPLVANTQPAFRFHNINSHAGELMAVYDRFMKQADDTSGIPAYVLGNPNVAGAGRTLGGLSLLMGNAAKGIKRIINNIDKDVTEPLVTAFVTLNMLFHPDETIKADSKVLARGSSGLLQRELSQARAVEVLQMLTPYAQAGLVPPEGLQIVIRDILRSLGYQADDIIPDPARQEELMNILHRAGGDAGGQGGIPQVESAAPGTPVPQLDGRSAAPAAPSGTQPFPGDTQGGL